MLDIDECIIGNYDCYVNVICINIIGLYNCICKEGFIGDGCLCLGIVLGNWDVLF